MRMCERRLLFELKPRQHKAHDSFFVDVATDRLTPDERFGSSEKHVTICTHSKDRHHRKS